MTTAPPERIDASQGIVLQFVPTPTITWRVPEWMDFPDGEGFWFYSEDKSGWPLRISFNGQGDAWAYCKSGGCRQVTKEKFPGRFWGPVRVPSVQG